MSVTSLSLATPGGALMLPLSLAEQVSSRALVSLSRPETEGNIIPVDGMLSRGTRGPKGSAADPWDDTIAVSPLVGFEDTPRMERLAPEAGISTGCRRTAPRLTPVEGSGTLEAVDSRPETPVALKVVTAPLTGRPRRAAKPIPCLGDVIAVETTSTSPL